MWKNAEKSFFFLKFESAFLVRGISVRSNNNMLGKKSVTRVKRSKKENSADNLANYFTNVTKVKLSCGFRCKVCLLDKLERKCGQVHGIHSCGFGHTHVSCSTNLDWLVEQELELSFTFWYN